MSSANKFRFNNQCVCRKQQCFFVQTQLCELVTPSTTVGDEPPVSDVTDVWCQPRPVSIYFQPAEAKYQTWLLLLSLCHHIKGFTEEFLSVLADFDAPPSLGGRTAAKQWFVNRIHFLRALLENRSTHLISQNTTLMGAAGKMQQYVT